MNANNYIQTLMIFYSMFIFSQEKENVYFIMDKNNDQYLITGKLNRFSDYITIYNRKEYNYIKAKVKEAKKKGEYSFDPESGKNNLNLNISKLTFKIKQKKNLNIDYCNLSKLRIVNYNWLLSEGWKQINGKDPITGGPLNFKNIYFLTKIDEQNYIAYKVGMTVVAH